MSEVTRDNRIGQEIGSYRITRLLGKGGMGAVYLGQHPDIGKQVAIKLLHPKIAATPKNIARFFQEAKAVNDIRHENIVDIFDFGKTPEGEYYLVMELLEGRSLKHLLRKEGALPPERIIRIGVQLCNALFATHQQGLIHRDLKPDNIFLIQRAGNPDFVKLLDFGIVKTIEDADGGIKTNPGIVLGTPMYLSPEQANREELDPLSDLYSLGLILYQMATGDLPAAKGPSGESVPLSQVEKMPSARAKNAKLPGALDAVILRCLEREKERRYPSMQALSLALEKAKERSLPKPLFLLGVCVLALGSVVGWALSRPASSALMVLPVTPALVSAPASSPAASSVPSPKTLPASTPLSVVEAPKEEPAKKKEKKPEKPQRPRGDAVLLDPFDKKR